MSDELKYVQIDIDELNEKIKLLNGIIGNTFSEIQNGISNLDLSKIGELTEWIKSVFEDSSTPFSIRQMAKEINETVSILNYDINSLKNNLILSDEEIKNKYESISQVMQLSNNSIREKILLSEKLKSLEEELNKYELKETPFGNMGYVGKLNADTTPYANIVINEDIQNNNNLQKDDIIEKSLKRGYLSAGYSFASSITASIMPLEKVNSLAQNLLKTFTEVVLKSVIFRTMFSGVSGIMNGEIPFVNNGMFGNNFAMPAIYSNQNLPLNKVYNANSNPLDVNVTIPKVEFKQTGYDLKAVINKVNKSIDRYK